MPSLTPYSLTFNSGLRVGTRGVNLEEAALPVPSDTLFAALVDVQRRTGADPAGFLAPFLQDPPNPPFLLTSAFPFAGEVRFYPAPAALPRLFSPAALAGRGKSLKRIRFLSEGLLIRALAGELMDDWLFPADPKDEPVHGAALQGGALWLAVDEIALLPPDLRRDQGKRRALRGLQVWSEHPVPRVTIDRITSMSTIYHSGRITFALGCGLWFGVHWRAQQPESRLAFEHAFALLGDDGLGGERSAGYGAFQICSRPDINLPDPQPEGLSYLLSRYHPRASELPAPFIHPGAAYHLDAVGGWLKSPDGPAQRRKRVHLVREGAILTHPPSPAGDLADVTPDYDNPAGNLPHRVYRFGCALAAGWSRKEHNHHG